MKSLSSIGFGHRPAQHFLLHITLIASLLVLVNTQAVGEDCSGTTMCGDTTAHVCETSGGTSLCKVKADATQIDCTSDNAKCPANAVCAGTGGSGTCSCNAGFIVDTAGLCTVQDAICVPGGTACGDITNYVCDTNLCKVKADGSATDCNNENNFCPANAECDGTGASGTCSCSSGFTSDGTGLCTAVVGKTCALASDCTSLLANTVCDADTSKCTCATGYTGTTCTAVIGIMICTSDSDCSSVLTNSYCKITYPCTKGTCDCSSGYSGTDCLTLGYDKACSVSNDKCDNSVGLACDSTTTKCKCNNADYAYKSDVGKCTDKGIFGDTCAAHTECLLTNTGNGDCISSKCACQSGYVMDTTSGSQSCRRPYAEESCSASCIKLDTTALLSGESSQTVPSCSNNKCVCGNGETLYSRKAGSLCYNFCLTDLVSGTTELANGATCTAFNACASKFCAKCPDETDAKCYDAPCNFGLKNPVSGIGFYLCLLIVSHFF